LGASERALRAYKAGVWLGEWEKVFVATALYMVDPRAEEEVLRDMAELAGSWEAAEELARRVWAIAYGEGYTLGEWASLLESLRTLSPWEAIWRFQELASRGLRRRRPGKRGDWQEDREILRTACKILGTG